MLFGLRTSPVKFFLGVVVSPGKVLDFVSKRDWNPALL